MYFFLSIGHVYTSIAISYGPCTSIDTISQINSIDPAGAAATDINRHLALKHSTSSMNIFTLPTAIYCSFSFLQQM